VSPANNDDDAHGSPIGPDAMLDNILHHVALEAAEHGISTARTDRWAERLHQATQSRLAAMRRQDTPPNPSIKRADPVPIAHDLLARDALVARIEHLRQTGHLRYAHLDLAALNDEDLRRLLAPLAEPDVPER
jgi:hypothetical protein